MNGTAAYKWLIGSTADSSTLNSHIQVSGNVSLTGAPKLTIANAGGNPDPGTTYTLVTYSGHLFTGARLDRGLQRCQCGYP